MNSLTYYKQVNDYIKDNKLTGKVSVKQEKSGVSLELQDEVLFDPGSVSIKPERFEAIGHGQYRPVADNKTTAGRQKS